VVVNSGTSLHALTQIVSLDIFTGLGLNYDDRSRVVRTA